MITNTSKLTFHNQGFFKSFETYKEPIQGSDQKLRIQMATYQFGNNSVTFTYDPNQVSSLDQASKEAIEQLAVMLIVTRREGLKGDEFVYNSTEDTIVVVKYPNRPMSKLEDNPINRFVDLMNRLSEDQKKVFSGKIEELKKNPPYGFNNSLNLKI